MIKKLIFLIFLIISVSSSAFADYTLPIGIPDPSDSFGAIDPIDDTAPSEPSPWTSDQSNYYYVDSTHGSCSDAGRGNRSIPRCTPPTSISEAGSATVLIVIEGGPYTSEWAINNINGSATYPIWVTGTSNESRTEFAPSSDTEIIDIDDSSYIIFQYLYLNGTNCANSIGMSIYETSSHIVLRHSDVKDFEDGSTKAAIHIGMTSDNIDGDDPNNYHVFYGLAFESIGLADGDWGVDVWERCATKFEYGVDHIWVLNSSFEDVGEDGTHIMNYHDDESRGPHDGQPQYIYIGDNTYYHIGEQAVDAKESEHVFISQNTIHGQRKIYGESWYHGSTGSHGEAITTNDEGYDNAAGDQSADYVWIMYNTIYDCVFGIYLQSGRRNYVIGNVIYDMLGTASGDNYGHAVWVDKANSTSSTCVAYIVNNTTVDAEYPFYANGVYDLYLSNNIWYELVGQSYYHIRLNNVKNSYEIKEDLFYDATEVRLYSASYCTGDNSCYADGASTDPDFTNKSTDDYSLQGNSPCINNGYDHSVYDTFYGLYGISIEYDFVGISRPQGLWDIGAYEYATSTTIALTGTLGDGATEAQIVAGGQLLIGSISNDTLVATFGADNQITTDFISGLDSGGAEAGGWDAIVKAGLTYEDVSRDSATQFTVTLPAFGSYAITQNETITCTVPASSLTESTDPVVATPTFEITALNPTVGLTGTLLPTATEAQVAAGGKTIIATISDAIWDADLGTDCAATTAFIQSFDAASSPTLGWNNVVRDTLTYAAVTRNSDTVATILLPAFGTYDISENENITGTIAAAATSYGQDITATPTIAIIFFDTSTEETVGMTLQ